MLECGLHGGLGEVFGAWVAVCAGQVAALADYEGGAGGGGDGGVGLGGECCRAGGGGGAG